MTALAEDPAPDAEAAARLERLLAELPKAKTTFDEDVAEPLARFGAAAVPRLLEAVKGPSATARWHAAVVLGRIGGAKAVAELRNAARQDKDTALKGAALRGLGDAGDPAAYGAVEAEWKKLVARPRQEGVGAAAEAMLRLDRKRALKTLVAGAAAPTKEGNLGYCLELSGAEGEGVVALFGDLLAAALEREKAEEERIRRGTGGAVEVDVRANMEPKGMIQVLREKTGLPFDDPSQWKGWIADNGPYLYWSRRRRVALVDDEAKAAGVPTAAFRKDHPWPAGQGPDAAPAVDGGERK
ncbi:MAG: HEAT repeat domain-containing protein [Planctomycetales bacterium]|nr:HEAT repeat domain-containing protein [Planctomycetales bacterium]